MTVGLAGLPRCRCGSPSKATSGVSRMSTDSTLLEREVELRIAVEELEDELLDVDELEVGGDRSARDMPETLETSRECERRNGGDETDELDELDGVDELDELDAVDELDEDETEDHKCCRRGIDWAAVVGIVCVISGGLTTGTPTTSRTTHIHHG